MLEENLKNKILKEMVADYKNALERNFELAKKLIRITPEGKVNVLFREKLTGKEQMLLYYTGKLYAKEAGFIETENVANKELMEELGIPQGSVLPWTMELRNSNRIKQIDLGIHVIPLNLVEKTLKELGEKVKINV